MVSKMKVESIVIFLMLLIVQTVQQKQNCKVLQNDQELPRGKRYRRFRNETGVYICGSKYANSIDTSPPHIANCPTNMEVRTYDQTALVCWETPTAVDAVDDQSKLQSVSSHTSPSTFPVGQSTVFHVVTDSSRNSAVCYFNVTVIKEKHFIVSPSRQLAFTQNTSKRRFIDYASINVSDHILHFLVTSEGYDGPSAHEENNASGKVTVFHSLTKSAWHEVTSFMVPFLHKMYTRTIENIMYILCLGNDIVAATETRPESVLYKVNPSAGYKIEEIQRLPEAYDVAWAGKYLVVLPPQINDTSPPNMIIYLWNQTTMKLDLMGEHTSLTDYNYVKFAKFDHRLYLVCGLTYVNPPVHVFRFNHFHLEQISSLSGFNHLSFVISLDDSPHFHSSYDIIQYNDFMYFVVSSMESRIRSSSSPAVYRLQQNGDSLVMVEEQIEFEISQPHESIIMSRFFKYHGDLYLVLGYMFQNASLLRLNLCSDPPQFEFVQEFGIKSASDMVHIGNTLVLVKTDLESVHGPSSIFYNQV